MFKKIMNFVDKATDMLLGYETLASEFKTEYSPLLAGINYEVKNFSKTYNDVMNMNTKDFLFKGINKLYETSEVTTNTIIKNYFQAKNSFKKYVDKAKTIYAAMFIQETQYTDLEDVVRKETNNKYKETKNTVNKNKSNCSKNYTRTIDDFLYFYTTPTYPNMVPMY